MRLWSLEGEEQKRNSDVDPVVGDPKGSDEGRIIPSNVVDNVGLFMEHGDGKSPRCADWHTGPGGESKI